VIIYVYGTDKHILNGGRKMSKFEVVKGIVESNKLDDNGKVNTIQTFLLGWLNESDMDWILKDEENDND
jgi:hypothetical protein